MLIRECHRDLILDPKALSCTSMICYMEKVSVFNLNADTFWQSEKQHISEKFTIPFLSHFATHVTALKLRTDRWPIYKNVQLQSNALRSIFKDQCHSLALIEVLPWENRFRYLGFKTRDSYTLYGPMTIYLKAAVKYIS